MFRRLDNAIISFFTNISHRFQRLTGLTNFWLAKQCWKIFLLAALFGAFTRNKEANIPSIFANPGSIIFWQILTLIIGIFGKNFFFAIIDEMEDHYASGHGTAHPLTLGMREKQLVSRLYQLVIFGYIACTFLFRAVGEKLFFFIFTALSGICLFMLIPFNYFWLVIPLPTGKSKIQEWREAFAAGFRQQVPIGAEK